MKKKIAALVLAAGMVVGIGGFGTFSYYMQDSKVQGEDNFITGKFECSVSWIDEYWSPAGDENSFLTTDPEDGYAPNIVKPDDIGYKTAVIENTGNLNAVVTEFDIISKDELREEDKDLVEFYIDDMYTLKDGNKVPVDKNIKLIAPEEKIYVKMAMKFSGDNISREKNMEHEIKVAGLDIIKLSVQQENMPVTNK